VQEASNAGYNPITLEPNAMADYYYNETLSWYDLLATASIARRR
jgi:hypothetical protein